MPTAPIAFATRARTGGRAIRCAVALVALIALGALGGCASGSPPRSATAESDSGGTCAVTSDAGAEPTLGAAAAVEPTLYDDLGGAAGVDALVEGFIRAIAADERIRGRYRHTDIARFDRMVQLQMCACTGGNCVYDGDDMRTIHTGMKIHPREFNAIVEALMTAMDGLALSVATQNRLLGIYAPMRDDIIDR